jgi:prostaglandin-E synthase
MRHPSILWAQRANEVYVTINLPEIVDETVDLTESGMSFTGTSHGLVYEFTLDFYASIVPEA